MTTESLANFVFLLLAENKQSTSLADVEVLKLRIHLRGYHLSLKEDLGRSFHLIALLIQAKLL